MKNFQTLLSSTFLLLIPLVLFTNCGEEAEIITESISLHFKAEVNGQALEFSTGRYTSVADNEISIDRIKMYISNIRFENSVDNTSYEEVDSYHLVSLNADKTSFSFDVDGIPDGFEFDGIKFAIGVDSDKNFSLDNTGDLDPANDMAWNWDTGYKFFKMEGNFYPADGSEKKGLIFHIGHDKNYKEFSIDFNTLKSINGTANIDFILDALAPMSAPNRIDLINGSDFQGGENADAIAENYGVGLFSSISTDL